jgi:hypothetical protein
MPAVPDRRRSDRSCHGDVPKVDRAVELALILPLEVGARLLEAIPATVDKVPATVARVQQEIVLARFIGKLAVGQGTTELKRRLSRRPEAASDADDDAGIPRPSGAPTAVRETAMGPTGGAADALEADRERAVAPADLALADYDQLAASQIVGMLAGLTRAERDAIEDHERRGRHRRTILGKLEQLREASE